MQCRSVHATLFTIHADNGDPLLLYGTDEEGWTMLWPTTHICKHPIAFARYCKRNIGRMRGGRLTLNHPMSAATRRWAEWLGVDFEAGVI